MSGQQRQPQQHLTEAHPYPQQADRPRPRPTPFNLADWPNRSKFKALAVHLLNEIDAGVYRIGDPVPSLRQMADDAQVSINTVQGAYDMLTAEGYLIPQERRGYLVAAAPERDQNPTQIDDGEAGPTRADDEPDPHHVVYEPSTARPHPVQTLYLQNDLPTQESRILDLDVRVIAPTAAVALALRQPQPTAPVVMRRLTLADPSGAPIEIRSRYLPAAIAGHTPLAEPEYLPGPWESLVWEYTGYAPASAETAITSRTLNPREAVVFGTPSSSNPTVLVRDVSLYSSRDASGPALSTTQHVLPGGSTRLIHRHQVQP